MKNVINWFNLPSTDFDRAIGFYSKVLDIQMTRVPSPDGFESAFFSTPKVGEVSGAISANPEMKPGSTGPVIYFDVNGKMEETLGRASANGGQIIMPKTDIGEFGKIAMVLDTEGNVIGFHSHGEK